MNEKKIQFNFVARIALILMLVAGLSGVIIVSINMFTSPIITENQEKAEAESLKAIFSGEAKAIDNLDLDNTSIEKVYEVKENNNISGYIYKVTGKNAYGVVSLLVGITLEGNVNKIEILENTESFKKKVDNHINSEYQNGDINEESIDDVDVKCGATYGAKLVKSLVKDALDHYQAHYQGGQK